MANRLKVREEALSLRRIERRDVLAIDIVTAIDRAARESTSRETSRFADHSSEPHGRTRTVRRGIEHTVQMSQSVPVEVLTFPPSGHTPGTST